MGGSQGTHQRRVVAHKIRISSRALRETAEAYERYEAQSTGLGDEFLTSIELQLKRLEQAPLLYAEVRYRMRRALLPRFPYAVFYTVHNGIVQVLAILHTARSPRKWPKRDVS